jgi:hypothetical protein
MNSARSHVLEIFFGASVRQTWCAGAAMCDTVMVDTAPTRPQSESAQTAASMRSLATQERLALGSPAAATSAPRARLVKATHALVSAPARATDMARVAMQMGDDARNLLTHSVPVDSLDGMRPLL